MEKYLEKITILVTEKIVGRGPKTAIDDRCTSEHESSLFRIAIIEHVFGSY